MRCSSCKGPANHTGIGPIPLNLSTSECEDIHVESAKAVGPEESGPPRPKTSRMYASCPEDPKETIACGITVQTAQGLQGYESWMSPSREAEHVFDEG